MKRVNFLLDTPIAWLEISGTTDAILGARWVLDDDAVIGSGLRSVAWKEAAEQQVKRYFEGSLYAFDLPLKFVAADAQIRSLKAIQSIEHGNTIDFQSFVAKNELNDLRMSDVMYAVGGNPFALIIPSHRVDLGDGAMGGSPLQRIDQQLREYEKRSVRLAS